MARILVVDDSIVMRRNLEKILVEAGHEVVGQAINGMQAVILYTELNPDIVTMDISMPIMSGVDAVSYIINKDPEASIIMISALNQKHMVFEAINNGAKHYIIKPIDKEILLKSINNILEDNKNRGIKSKEATDNQDLGFKITNNNGTFEFLFNSNLSLRDIVPSETAITGLLFINPLKVIFNFDALENVSDRVLLPIIRSGNNIKKSMGVIEYTGENKELLIRVNQATNEQTQL